MHEIGWTRNSSSQSKRNRIFFALLTAVMASGMTDCRPAAAAGPNDFFGSSMPQGQMSDPARLPVNSLRPVKPKQPICSMVPDPVTTPMTKSACRKNTKSASATQRFDCQRRQNDEIA